MLILVYLVCMLSQTNGVSSSDNSGVYPIENSQKLMLTIPTEIHSDGLSDFDSLYSTTESLTTIIDNSISKTDNIYIGTHPLFPIQEPTTTPMSPIGQIKLEQEILPQETSTVTVPESSSEEELATSTTTKETTTEEIDHTCYAQETTTTKATVSILTTNIPESALPIKRSLSLDALQTFKAIPLEITTESLINMSTPTISLEELTEKDQPSTNLPTSTNPQDDEHLQNSSSVPAISIDQPVSENDDLFIDNWSNQISAENKDIHLDFKDYSSSPLSFMEEPTKSLFQNEDSEFASIESAIMKNDSNNSPVLEQQINSGIEDANNLQYTDTAESQPIFSPQNLLNLFTFDHQPSPSDLKTTWWPKSKSSSMSVLAESAAKNQQKRANRISPNDDSQEMSGNQRMFSQGFDNLLNRKLKNSVSLLERLFGNYFLQ